MPSRIVYTLFITSLSSLYACRILQLQSEGLGVHLLHAEESHHTDALLSHRAVYRTMFEDAPPLYLYHRIANEPIEGVGRWVLNNNIEDKDSAIAYVDSWAVMPHLIHAVNDPGKESWIVRRGEVWESDHSFTVRCMPHEDSTHPDSTVYIDISGFAWPLSGFYVQLGENDSPVFAHVSSVAEKQWYLFKRGSTWIIGENPNSPEGLAYVRDDSPLPGLIEGVEWYYSSNGDWQALQTTIISGNADRNVYAGLHDYRSIDFLPESQNFIELKNGIIFPSLGLGTGGIPLSIIESVLIEAIKIGYRMFDMAREYGNEAFLGRILRDSEADSPIPLRDEIFIISKVWPTHLGFNATSNEIQQSLTELESSYVDSYLLHWPICDPSVHWMHCEDTVDKSGTWGQSWRALERAYAEGSVMSIGVSNFDKNLLEVLQEIAVVTPHIVQNHETIGALDMGARIWCGQNDAVFVPYATARNLDFIPSHLKDNLASIAQAREISEHAVVHRFFTLIGSAVIPRSTNAEHLEENLITCRYELIDDEMAMLGWNVNVNSHNEL